MLTVVLQEANLGHPAELVLEFESATYLAKWALDDYGS